MDDEYELGADDIFDELGWDDGYDSLEGYGEEIVGDDDDDWDDDDDDEDEYDEELDAIISGYDDYSADEIGARRRRPRRRRRRSRGRGSFSRAAIMKALARRGARARRRPPSSGKFLKRVQNRQLRRYPLGLGATVIGAGATAIITANPQLPFQVAKLAVAISALSSGLLIDALAVGTVSQFVAAGSVPIEVFAPDAVGVQLKGDTAVPGVSVQITVSNPTGGGLTFSGAIIGSVAQ